MFIALSVALISVILLLYVGWVVLSWRTGILLFLGVLLLALLITGVILNTFFLVREIRRNEQHDAFINAVTHELKTPVASIRLYLQTLQTRPVNDTTRQKFYSIMVEDSDRLLATIEQILRTGRVGSTRGKPILASLNLGKIIEECVARARTLHQLPPDSLAYIPGASVTILADLDEFQAAISNLIDNAVKYSGSEKRITVETAAAGADHVLVRVRDQGAGIPKTELKQIFKRFHRVPGMAATRIPGTGLGLYIVRSVAKRHGGRAWAESEGPGHGSTFVLELPVAR